MPIELYSCARMPWPVDWLALFGRPAPLYLEIGFGGGQFLLEMAAQRPLQDFIGLEISLPSLRKVARKLEKANLPNVRLFQGGAEAFLWALCPPELLSGIYINFPDPWPKAGHHHRRLITPQFLHLAATRLKPGALLEIATDHAEYAAVIHNALSQTPYFTSQLDVPFLTEDETRTRTKYELRGLAQGSICHYFKWQRTVHPAPDSFPIPQEAAMPHVVLRTPLTLGEIANRFTPMRITTETAALKFIELFQSPQDGKLLIDVYISEQPMSQRVGLTVCLRQDEKVVIGLHEVGFPRPTTGVHHAVRALADWLLALHPQSTLLNSNVHQVNEP